MKKIIFSERTSIEFVEEDKFLAPKFDADGLIPVVVTDKGSDEVMMLGYMNEESLKKTILTGEAYYWSRSRKKIWKKGSTSGMKHIVKDILIDDDQDALWIKVIIEGLGASCHVGYKSCFYRSVSMKKNKIKIIFKEKKKIFNPKKVYKGLPNPTKI